MKTCKKCKEFYSDAISNCKSCGAPLVPCDSSEGLPELKSSTWASIITIAFGFCGVGYLFSGLNFVADGTSGVLATIELIYGTLLLVITYALMNFKRWAPYVLYALQAAFILLNGYVYTQAIDLSVREVAQTGMILNGILLIISIVYFSKRKDLFNE